VHKGRFIHTKQNMIKNITIWLPDNTKVYFEVGKLSHGNLTTKIFFSDEKLIIVSNEETLELRGVSYLLSRTTK